MIMEYTEKLTDLPKDAQIELIRKLLLEKEYIDIEYDNTVEHPNEVEFNFEGYSDADVQIQVKVVKDTNRITIKQAYIADKHFELVSLNVYVIYENALVRFNTEPLCPICGEQLKYYNIEKVLNTYVIHDDKPVHTDQTEINSDVAESGYECTNTNKPCNFIYSIDEDDNDKYNVQINEVKRKELRVAVEILTNITYRQKNNKNTIK